jgi:hypothetical protein
MIAPPYSNRVESGIEAHARKASTATDSRSAAAADAERRAARTSKYFMA